MKVQEIMERAGVTETGRAIAYIKDGLEEMNLISDTNIMRGTKTKAVGSGVVFDGFNVNNPTLLTGLPGSGDSVGEPDNWTEYESESMGSTRYSKAIVNEDITGYASLDPTMMAMYNNDNLIIGSAKAGFYQAVAVKTGAKYRFKCTLHRINASAAGSPGIAFGIGASAPSGTTVASELASNGLYSTSATDKACDHTFKATADTIYITIFLANGSGTPFDDDVYSGISNISFTGYGIYKSGLFTGFKNLTSSSDINVLIEGSSANETDQLSVAPNGYLVAESNTGSYPATDNVLNLTTEITNETVSGETTIRAQSFNYQDIKKDKRYYDLPSDSLRIKSINVKNHLNTDDQWRSIPRMIGKPLNTDKDEI